MSSVQGNYSRFMEDKDDEAYFKRLPATDTFRVLFAPNERFSQSAFDHLKLKGFQVDTYPMVGGDIWITMVIDGVDYVIAVIELKSFNDMRNCLTVMHTHIRNQINSLHHSTEKLKLKKVLFVGKLEDLSPKERRIYTTLSLSVEMEHPERVTFGNIVDETELPYYILTIVDLFNKYGENPREFPRLEKLNDSINRNTPNPDNPSDFVLLHLKEVRNVGKKAEIIASLFDSVEHMLEVAEKDGPLFLTKKKGREILGDTLSTAVYKSIRRPEYHAECPQPKKRKPKATENMDQEWPEESELPTRTIKRIKKDEKEKKRDEDEMEAFRALTGLPSSSKKSHENVEDSKFNQFVAKAKATKKKGDSREEAAKRITKLTTENTKKKDAVQKKVELSGSETEDESGFFQIA